MVHEENKFFEVCRIMLSKELDIPPDDILLLPIIQCCKRSIEKCCRKSINSYYTNKDAKKEEYIIMPENEEERTAFSSEYGTTILNKIFTQESPFFDWIDKYENEYLNKYFEEN